MLAEFFTLPILFAVALALLAFLLILEPESLTSNSLNQRKLNHQFRSSKHKWEKSQLKSFYFCYLCHKLISSWFSNDVLECKKCGVIIHRICRYLKLRKPECKYIIAKQPEQQGDTKFYHQWRQCSYNASSTCSICDSLCVGVETYICIWCHRVKHGSCAGMTSPCDFGNLRKFILQPTEISCANTPFFTAKAFQSLHKKEKKIKERTSEGSENSEAQEIEFHIKDKSKKPIIVVINKKSGGQTGNEFIKAFYQSLNPLQVISILDQGLEKLNIFVKLPRLTILIAGGDGTVCSVMNYLKTIPEWQSSNPPAAILPLGTGNDLSRSLGWGFSADQVNPEALIVDINKRGRPELLDRWRMVIESQDQLREMTLYNYLGIGLDGRICKQFHEIREKYPSLFFSQFSNKIIYTQMGAVDLFTGSKVPLSQLIQIRVNGEVVNIEDIENVILLNIFHWGGGVTNLWESSSQFTRQSYSDGILEVIGLSDVVHMGQVQVGMDSPFQLAQGSVIEITSLQAGLPIPVQIDGEPLEVVTPVKITISRKDQVNVLATNNNINSRVLEVLMEGLKEGLIDQDKFEQLVAISNKLHKE